jgi:hypothetical protein
MKLYLNCNGFQIVSWPFAKYVGWSNVAKSSLNDSDEKF